MFQNAYLVAKIGADTAKNEQHLAEMLPKICNYPTGPAETHGLSRSRSTPRAGGPWRTADLEAVYAVVERFDIGRFSDFSAK